MLRLEGKVAIVTGGSRGIGAEIVKMFANEGAHVVFTYNKSPVEARKLKEYLDSEMRNCEYYMLDAGSELDNKDLIEKVYEEHRQLDILVNNAGINLRTPTDKITFETLEEMFNVNVFGPIYLSSLASPYMDEGSSIINITSVAGSKTVKANGLEYGASKAALNMATRQLSREFAPQGIRVNAIAPSFTNTSMMAKYSEEELAAKAAKLPLGKLIEPSDVAYLALELALGHGPYGKMTGEILYVDSGAHAK